MVREGRDGGDYWKTREEATVTVCRNKKYFLRAPHRALILILALQARANGILNQEEVVRVENKERFGYRVLRTTTKNP